MRPSKTGLQVPYEVATAHTLLGQALREAGDESAAKHFLAHHRARREVRRSLGAQGTAWTIFRAIHAGTTRVVAFGGCAIPSPLPAEPSGISLVCDDVGYADEVSVTVQ